MTANIKRSLVYSGQLVSMPTTLPISTRLTFAILSVSVTMVSRLLLNLHSAVSPILEPDDLTVDSTSHGGLTILSAGTDERGSHSMYETYEMRVGLAF